MRSQRGQLLVAEAAGLLRGPARCVNRAVDEQQRQRDIIGDAFGAHVVEDRKASGSRDRRCDARTSSPSPNTIVSGLLMNSGKSRKSKSTVPTVDLGARPPDEIAAEDVGMQGADENADPPQRQPGLHQPLAEFRHHLGAGRSPTSRRRSASRRGSAARCVHDACICGAVCGKRQGDENARASAWRATCPQRPTCPRCRRK